MSNWWAFLSWYENVIVWPLAIAVFLLLLKAKRTRWRVTFGVLLVVVFLPHIQTAVGDVYFDYLCRTQAGEFIYRTVDNVEGILQLRPRDGSKDYFDRMRAGDIPEDPWGHTNLEARNASAIYVGAPGSGRYSYIERYVIATSEPLKASSTSVLRESLEIVSRNSSDLPQRVTTVATYADRPKSRYGYIWAERTGFFHWIFNIHPGQVDVVEVRNNEVMARKRGFLRSRPWGVCPGGKDEDFIFRFVVRVLKPMALEGSEMK
jgi:hypothetical protein